MQSFEKMLSDLATRGVNTVHLVNHEESIPMIIQPTELQS